MFPKPGGSPVTTPPGPHVLYRGAASVHLWCFVKLRQVNDDTCHTPCRHTPLVLRPLSPTRVFVLETTPCCTQCNSTPLVSSFSAVNRFPNHTDCGKPQQVVHGARNRVMSSVTMQHWCRSSLHEHTTRQMLHPVRRARPVCMHAGTHEMVPDCMGERLTAINHQSL